MTYTPDWRIDVDPDSQEDFEGDLQTGDDDKPEDSNDDGDD